MKKKLDYHKMHYAIVHNVLDKTDIPFCEVETHKWKKGTKHRYKGKVYVVDYEQIILISSYIKYKDKTIRISNHRRKNGVPDDIIDIVYDWQTGKINNKEIKNLLSYFQLDS